MAAISVRRWWRARRSRKVRAMDTQCTGRVFIVEDSAPIRSRLVEMLGEVEGLRVVGEAESPAEAVAGITETRPDCVVLDFQLIGGTAVDVLRAVHPLSPEIAFIVLTNIRRPSIAAPAWKPAQSVSGQEHGARPSSRPPSPNACRRGTEAPIHQYGQS
jgi:CheY-like chemotaxis protein